MQPNKTKTVLMYIPHMAPLARITAITASGLTSNEQFKAAAAVSAVIPTMQLKPEHITEVTTGIEKQIDELQSAGKKHEKALVNQLINHLVDASKNLVANNHVKQNGTGDVAGAQSQTQPQRGQVAGSKTL